MPRFRIHFRDGTFEDVTKDTADGAKHAARLTRAVKHQITVDDDPRELVARVERLDPDDDQPEPLALPPGDRRRALVAAGTDTKALPDPRDAEIGRLQAELAAAKGGQ